MVAFDSALNDTFCVLRPFIRASIMLAAPPAAGRATSCGAGPMWTPLRNKTAPGGSLVIMI